MALVQKQRSERTILLLGVFGAIVVAGLLLYFLWIAPPSSTTNSTSSSTTKRDVPIVTDFQDELFADPRFKALKQNGDLPVNIGNVGRENPFVQPST
jgi:flagellar basal body-associated protein FliL